MFIFIKMVRYIKVGDTNGWSYLVSRGVFSPGADRVRPRSQGYRRLQHGDRQVAGHYLRDSGRTGNPLWRKSAAPGNADDLKHLFFILIH